MRRRKKPFIINLKDRNWERIKRYPRSYLFLVLRSSLFISFGLWFLFLIFSKFHLSGRTLLDILGAGFVIGIGVLDLLASHAVRRLVPEEQLHERLNADYVTLDQVMRKNGVQPRYIINGERYYSPSDFGDIATLLRASIAPVATQEALLRPATDHVATPQKQLLRAAESTSEQASLPESIAANHLQQQKQAEEQPNRLG